VSPAVVVLSLLSLHAQGYGVDKGIPTLLIAASCIDDVIAITGFGVVLGIAFSTGMLHCQFLSYFLASFFLSGIQTFDGYAWSCLRCTYVCGLVAE